MSKLLSLSIALPVFAACGDNDSVPLPEEPAWRELLAGEWSLPASAEDWFCATKTLTEDLVIGGLRPIDPPGTHHTVVTFGPPDGPDRAPTPCDPNEANLYPAFASGVNTNALELPAGIGIKIPAGQQVHLNLHVFNSSDAPLSGTSGIEIREVPTADLVHEAEIFLPGPLGFQIPQNQEYSYKSTCQITAEQHIFALFPHMHQLGRHFKVEVTTGGQRRTLWDKEYRFDGQTFSLFPELTLQPGDEIETTCTWFYPTTPGLPPVIGWGNSSRDEMCFAIMMRYPRLLDTGEHSADCTDEEF